MLRDLFGRELLGVLRGEERVEIGRAAAPEFGRQLLKRADELAQLARELAALEKRVEREAEVLGAGLGRALQIAVVAEKHVRVLRDIVRGRGEFGIDERHVAVGGGEEHVAAELLGVALERLDEARIGRLAPLLPRDERV
jgi:hypothetical protein